MVVEEEVISVVMEEVWMFSEEKVDMLRRFQKKMKMMVEEVVLEMKEVVVVVREKNDE